MADTLVRETRTPTRAPAPGWRDVVTVSLFTVTAFVGAALLFVVQPMVARLVLPSFGGSATVWSTSSLFFQVLLLAGYAYSHGATRFLGRRWQPSLHLLVLLAPLAVLPITLPPNASPDADASPVWWLLRVLALMIGLPFVVMSTSGPLLQRWYSWSGGPRADDPYFLFAASNLGSFGGLLAYPLVIEPLMTLQQQRTWWSWGFVGFVVLTALCAALTRRRTAPTSARAAVPSPTGRRKPLGRRRMARWALLAFLPSAMMLAVTAHVSTDIAPIPLLWVIPLAIYLATFVVAFGRSSRRVPQSVVRLAVCSTFVAAAASLMQAGTPTILGITLNMVILALVAFVAHSRLAADRPGTDHLTAFYLVIAAGGAVGGLLNGMVAPIVLDRVLEYPLVMALVPLLLLPGSHGRRRGGRDRRSHEAEPADAGGQPVPATTRRLSHSPGRSLLTLGVLALSVPIGLLVRQGSSLLTALLLGLAVAGVIGWLLSTRRTVAVVVLVVSFVGIQVKLDGGSLDHRRTFFGSYRVFESNGQHAFAHGTTLHGTQWLGDRSSEPTTYFSRSGPLGDVLVGDEIKDIGVVGLGVGTIAAYGRAGQHFTFVEIDRAVVEIAKNPRLFTYLRDSPARVDVIVGDGRIEAAKLPPQSLDVLMLDAFSSDAIPVHLLTEEAMRTYAHALRPGGLLVVHISNKTFDLAPVVNADAEALGWSGRIARKGSGDGATLSRWVVLSQDPTSLAGLSEDKGWQPLRGPSVVWTDHHSSVLSVLR